MVVVAIKFGWCIVPKNVFLPWVELFSEALLLHKDGLVSGT